MADFACADNAAIESCTGTVADGETMTKGSLGNKVFRVTAIDTAGNMTTTDVPYMVNSTSFDMNAGTGSVDTVLALATGTTPANFGAFQVGVAREYLATAAPRITSTAGNVALTVQDNATTATGRLVNGTAALSQVLQVYSNGGSGATAGPGGNVGGAAAPTALATWTAPGHQRCGQPDVPPEHHRTETLRSGTYGKTLTFTL